VSAAQSQQRERCGVVGAVQSERCGRCGPQPSRSGVAVVVAQSQ
jgi:hypothetical protein